MSRAKKKRIRASHRKQRERAARVMSRAFTELLYSGALTEVVSRFAYRKTQEFLAERSGRDSEERHLESTAKPSKPPR